MSEATPERLAVRKTYKLYVGGAFPRSESGRTYEVRADDGRFLANAALASRKDARDAVVAARKAFPGWSAATAYNRGQVLYRVAELLEGRRDQFVAEVADGEGLSPGDAAGLVDAAIDRWVWYAGWSDKVHQVRGSSNPVAGPYFDFSVPEPTGVVAVVAPASSLLGLVSVLAPVIVTGNTCVVVADRAARCPRSRCPRCWPRPTSPAGSSTCSPATPPRSPRGWPPTWTSTPSTSPASPTPSWRPISSAPRPRTSSGWSARPPGRSTGPSTPASTA